MWQREQLMIPHWVVLSWHLDTVRSGGLQDTRWGVHGGFVPMSMHSLVCVCMHSSWCMGPCTAQSKQSTPEWLYSEVWWRRQRERGEARSSIAPVFNAPEGLDNRRSNKLLIVFITKLIFWGSKFWGPSFSTVGIWSLSGFFFIIYGHFED